MPEPIPSMSQMEINRFLSQILEERGDYHTNTATNAEDEGQLKFDRVYDEHEIREYIGNTEALFSDPPIFKTYEDILMAGYHPDLMGEYGDICNCGDCRQTRRTMMIDRAVADSNVREIFHFTHAMMGGAFNTWGQNWADQHSNGALGERTFPKVDPRVAVQRYTCVMCYEYDRHGEAMRMADNPIVATDDEAGRHIQSVKRNSVYYLSEAHFKTCACCGQAVHQFIQNRRFDRTFYIMADDSILCQKCFNEQGYFECLNCHQIFLTNDGDLDEDPNYYSLEGGKICSACRDDSYGYCCSCDNIFHNDDLIWVEERDESYCESCHDRRFTRCRHCDSSIDGDDQDDCHETQDGLVCDSCFEEYYAECVSCEEQARREWGRWRDDEFTCGNCLENSTAMVRQHSYKPRAKFFKLREEAGEQKDPGATLFFGFELEVENVKNENRIDDVCLMSDKFWDDHKMTGLTYYKHDGSLSYGVEIVSHPMSWEFINSHRAEFVEWLTKIKSMGFRSWSTKTCGLHIHMNKTAFNGQRMYKFMKFFHENGDFIFTCSGRKTYDEMSQWAQIDNEGATKANLAYEAKHKAKQKFGRYFAVNLEPSRTMEIRIFKGTLNGGSFLRAFELLRSLYLFTANGVVSILNTTPSRYRTFLNTLPPKEFGNIQTLLKNVVIGSTTKDGTED